MIPCEENPALLDSITSFEWTYRFYHRTAETNSFPVFSSFHALWQSKAGDRSHPAWSDFDFYDFRGWHGWVYVGEVTADRQDFRFRLFGSHIVDLLGDDYTGRLFSQIEEGSAAGKQVEMEMLPRQVDEGLLVHMEGPINWQGRHHQMMETLALPLSEDGGQTTHILAATQKI